MTEYGNCTEIIRAHAATRGDQPALIFSGDAGDEILTYARLDQLARRTAALLRQQLVPGDRALLLNPSGPGFVTNFLGCLYAGVIATTAPVPDGYQRRRQRLAGIVADAEVSMVLTESSFRQRVCSWLAEESLTHLSVLAPDRESGALERDWSPSAIDPRTIAFLQYTSGSLSTPKGVVVDHGNVVHNARLFLRAVGVDVPGARVGGWLPMFHDFGLIGMLLSPLVHGGCSVLMPPSAFLRRPVSWLELIDRHNVIMSGGPNFAYELCTRRVTDAQLSTLDLSRWRSAVNGSEPVRPRTMREFCERFAVAGLRPEAMSPGYGMAEATLCVTTSSGVRPPVTTTVDAAWLERGELVPAEPGPAHGNTRELAGCGPVSKFDIRVVEPTTRAVLCAGQIGEIWVRGPSVTRGYWNQPEETDRAFGAVTVDGDGGYLRTGDLGAVLHGELYITGRIKELLIVHGRKLYPQDIEAEVRTAHPALTDGVGAVFTAADDQVVVVHECRGRRRTERELAAIAREIRATLSRQFGIATPGVVLTRHGVVQRTTSGKIQRSAMRERYLSGELDAVYAAGGAR